MISHHVDYWLVPEGFLRPGDSPSPLMNVARKYHQVYRREVQYRQAFQ